MDEEMLDRLILDGIVEVSGIDQKTGEMLYNFTSKILEHPELMRSIEETHIQEIYTLWEKGFVDINMHEANPTVKITEKALDEDAIDKLPYHLQISIRQIVELSRIDGDL